MKFLTMGLFLMLAGCGSSEDAGTDSTEATEAKDRETVFDPMVDALDKARGVEDTVLQQKLEMDAALKRMEGETDDQ